MRKEEILERMDRLSLKQPYADMHLTLAGEDLDRLHPGISKNSDLVPNDLALRVIHELFENMDIHPIKTAEGFRNAALGNGMFAINPLMKVHERPQVDFLMGAIRRVINDGKMIDFGFIPNQVLKAESLRARSAFELGELQQPYDSWLGVSAWEGGMCGYFFAPMDDGRVFAIELYGVAPPGLPDAILVNDILAIEPKLDDTRIQPFRMLDGVEETDSQIRSRGANVLDPLVTFLRFLADASIPVIDQPEPVRLNKHRVRQGKFPIPAHTRVETRDYVSMLTRHTGRTTPQGGHHASPIAHWRRAHQRHLPSGRTVPVRSSRVNWRDGDELHRIFYRTPQK